VERLRNSAAEPDDKKGTVGLRKLMSLLIVDAEPGSLRALEAMLAEARRWNIVVAATVADAVRVVESGEIQLVLADLMAPGMSGLDLCHQIGVRPEFCHVPVVVLVSPENGEQLNRIYEAGACDYIMRPLHLDEVVARIGAVLRSREEILRRAERERELVAANGKLEAANQWLEQQSLVDPVTGVANRRSFDQMLDRVWRSGARHDFPVALIMMDVDFFKAYNDRLGHPAGDACLARLAKGLANGLKRPDDFVARYGGEEFAAILPRTDLGGAMMVAERLRCEIQNLGIVHPASPQRGFVTISLGVACQMPARSLTSSSVIAAADRALYEAKRLGRNRLHAALSDFAAQQSHNRTPGSTETVLSPPKL
jgi:diguanylate cyclase (GGDEF)-like protein